MSSAQTSLYNTYLISGQYDNAKGEVVEKTVVPVANGFFTRMNHKEQSLVTTDDFGMLHSIGASGNRLQRISDDNVGSLQLNLIPPGIARSAYFLFDKEWQTKLMEGIHRMSLPPPFEPIPVTFTDKHLRPGHDTDDELIQAHFKGKTCKGQLIPRMHVLTVLIDKAIMASVPPTLSAHCGGKEVILSVAASPISLEIGGKHSAQFVVYAASGRDLKEGNYTLSLPAKAVSSHWHRREDASHAIKRSFQVAFGTHTLFGDFDFQVLDLPSVEDAILAHFAERYPHLLIETESDSEESKAYKAAETSLERFRAASAVLGEAKKTAVGFVNADASERTRTIVDASLKALRDSNTRGISEEAGVAQQILSKMHQGKETIESWKKFFLTRENAAALKLVEQVMDGSTIERIFQPNKWRDAAVKAMQDVEAKKGNLLGRLLLVRKENADRDLLKKLMKNATAPKAFTFEATVAGKVKAGPLWALDVAANIKNMAATIDALSELRTDADGHAARLRKHMDEYGKRYGSAPCTEVVRRLEVLRKAADEATGQVDEKTLELVEQSAKLTLKALSLVPLVGQFVDLASLGIETLEALTSVIDAGSDLVDRVMWRHRSMVKRFSELSKLHALQVRAIAEATTKKQDDPHTQFRLRVIILIGLLRLIERCGSPQSNPKKFEAKVKQYQIGKYIEYYLLAEKPFPIALSSGTPMDEVWGYCCGNKNSDWNDLAAAVGSVSEYLTDLVRGSRIIAAPLAFQKCFPIHGMGAKSATDLATAFSLNFAGVIDSLAFSCVYVRRDKKEKWVAADKASFKVEPGTAVRVVAVFKSSGDLTGVPMSLQIKRTDPTPSIDGPVYKSSLGRTTAAISDDLDDKGLLSYTPESQFIGDRTAFSCVFYPFYFFRDHMIQGIKPFGHIGLSGDITLDFGFEVKAGDDGKFASTGGLGYKVQMHMRTTDKLHTEMILNKAFLDHKASDADHGKMWFNPKGIQGFQVGSVHWRCGDGDWKYAKTSDGRFVMGLTTDDGFAWGKSFELMVVFGSLYAERENWPGDPIRVPAQMVMREKSDGPAFPVEIYSMYRNEAFSVVTSEMVQRALLANKLLTVQDISPGKFSPAGFATKDPMALWAVRIHFKYQVEGTDGEMQNKEGLRPFGKSYVDSNGTYTYHFNLRSSDSLGLKIENVLELTVPGVPASLLDGTAVAGDTGWITDEYRRKSLRVEKIR